MKWVTEPVPRPTASPAVLIRRFIDPDAEILYVATDQVLAWRKASRRTLRHTRCRVRHRGNQCTFEVLIDDYDLGGDPALVRLARIVHAADIDSELHTDPSPPALLALAFGGLDVELTTTGCSSEQLRLRRPVRLVFSTVRAGAR